MAATGAARRRCSAPLESRAVPDKYEPFDRDDFAQAAGDQWEEAIWFLGEDALIYRQNVENKRLPPLQLESRSFPDAGWYIMRHEDMYMFIIAGQNGQNGFGGHAHNDKLSFELYATVVFSQNDNEYCTLNHNLYKTNQHHFFRDLQNIQA